MLSAKVKFNEAPTVVVAICAALAKVGAGIEVNDALVNRRGVGSVPPHAESIKLLAPSEVAKGSNGAPAKVCNHWRRLN